MSAILTVEYDRFVQLGGTELCAYMEPFLSAATTNVSRDVLERILSGLRTYDEYHLVYALELGSQHCPELFASHIPTYLTDARISVFCAAARTLEKLPDKFITQEIVDAVREVRDTYPERDFLTDLLERLADRCSRPRDA